eukprot:Anaeramoba_ignava/a481359_25.p2 GENE.a481359_25~~a481359_25.p2  ORF type:complete len:423 (-),score=43.07 a481359_25:60-1328(-)
MKYLSLYVLIFSLLFTACSKNEEPEVKITIAQDPKVVEILSDSLLQNMISESLIERTSLSTEFSNSLTRKIMESAATNYIDLSEIIPDDKVYNGNYIKQTYKLSFSSQYSDLISFIMDMEQLTVLGKIDTFKLFPDEDNKVTGSIDFSIYRIVNRKVVDTAELKHLTYNIKSEKVRAKRIGIFCELYAQTFHWSDLLKWMGSYLQESVSLDKIVFEDSKMAMELKVISQENVNSYTAIYKVIDELQKLPDSKRFFEGFAFEGSRKDMETDDVTVFTVSAVEYKSVIKSRKLDEALTNLEGCIHYEPVAIDSITKNPFNFVPVSKADKKPESITQDEAGFRISSTMKNSSGKYFAMVTVGDKKQLMSVGEVIYDYVITGINREEVNLEDSAGNKFILKVAGVVVNEPIEEKKSKLKKDELGDY